MNAYALSECYLNVNLMLRALLAVDFKEKTMINSIINIYVTHAQCFDNTP
jgi:hypothetical protein